MKIAISTETTSDLTDELLQKYEISTIPFGIYLGETERPDGDVTPKEIFDFVAKKGTLPKTSAVNEYQYTEYFKELLKTHDYVIHFSLSSEISSACSNAIRAGSNLKNVFVVNSKSLSTGIALLAIKARNLANEGYAPENIAEICENLAPSVQASFVLENLKYLYKGGRCNSLQLLGANLLRLRPQIIVKNGKMSSAHKYRGTMEKVVENYCHDILAEFNTPDLDVGFVTYTTATPEMINAAKNALKQRGFKNIYETTARATITSHCGEHTLGILYINKK